FNLSNLKCMIPRSTILTDVSSTITGALQWTASVPLCRSTYRCDYQGSRLS
ncbi:Hypothetical predicted protein, partial [Marmota monax]